jgi:hypothetical protein
MNKAQRLLVFGVAFATLLAGAASARPADQQSGGEDFFVISSIDRAKHLLVLLQPTEVTEAMGVSDKTQFFDDKGKALKITDFRAGETVFITSHRQADGSMLADRVRKGYMTVAEMRRRYVPFLPEVTGKTSKTNSQP